MQRINREVEHRISFETSPERYRHWKLTFRGPIATLVLDVDEESPLRPGYVLKLNSYDLGVDLELADALERIRFEHPETRALVLTSARDRVFSAGANIPMLGSSSHPFKVNFCKYTNETRLFLEDLAEESGVRTLCAVNGICAGGGYELALACERILLVEDGNAAVSLPETPLLGVLPGTGGLTRLMDKRRVRRDRADAFCTTAEGIRGTRAAEWNLVDAVIPKSRFLERVDEDAAGLAADSARDASGLPIRLAPLDGRYGPDRIEHRHVEARIDSTARIAEITIRGPASNEPATPEEMAEAGADLWALRAFRELDDVLLHLRFNHETVGLIVLRTEGDPEAVRRVDRSLAAAQSAGADRDSSSPISGLAREILGRMRRTLKRLDLTGRSIFALITPDSCFAGCLLETALAADRVFMKQGSEKPALVGFSVLNGRGSLGRPYLPAASGISRLEARLWSDPERARELIRRDDLFGAEDAVAAGVATFAPDEIDWEDEIRIALEERVSLSPDALTAMEASLRFPGPETMETRIFGRLSAWQNWVFSRSNATGARGALTLYGKPERPEFDWRRT